MCGITVAFGHVDPLPNELNHRGPDGYGRFTLGKCTMHFNRLSINDLSPAGMQPFHRNGAMLVCNGEIYNHKDFETGKEVSSSDCECLLGMIDRYGIHDTCNLIRGVFAMAWSDGDRLMVARDPFGVRPLFYVKTSDGIAFASEIKALALLNGKIEIFPPGHFYDSFLEDFVCYHNIHWTPCITEGAEPLLKNLLIEAVQKRVANTDREVGFLLSGGLDSSLVAAIGSKLCKNKIKTFSIGRYDSPDVLAAQWVADTLNTEHYHVPFEFEDAIEAVPQVIKSLESYDTTTIRASTPMWMLCKWIKENTECRVLLSGEGSDEILGGYRYFKGAPSDEAFQAETIRRLRFLHQFDVLRADRCTAAHGLELRVPFLDRDFVEAVIQLEPSLKRTKEEKKVLRDAFEGYGLPENVLRRPKDAFSDAVGYGWVDHIKDHCEKTVPDVVLERTTVRCQGHNPPLTKEEAWFRQIFWETFGHDKDHLITEIWRPKWTNVTEPSARYLEEKNES